MEASMAGRWRWSWAIPLMMAGVCAGAGPGAAPPAATVPGSGTSTAAASSPASLPVTFVADYSTPAAAAKTLLTAINRGNFTAMRDALTIPDEHKEDIDTLLDAMESSARLQEAAEARFLEAGKAAFGAPSDAALAAQLKSVDAGEVTINGNSATLAVAADAAAKLPGGTVEFRKIGKDWKIDGAAFFKLATEPADKTAARVALARRLTVLTGTIIQEMDAGKFFSATDAYQEYWMDYLDLTRPPATATASAPATATSPAQP